MLFEFWVIIGIIVLFSFDTTLFLQSMISQPIISCQIIGFFVGNYELGLAVGGITQLFYLAYLPIGGARIPDPQIAPNLIVLFLAPEISSIELIGLWLPVIIVISIGFMFVTSIERLIATWYMKYIPYRFLNLNLIISSSFLIHFIGFYYLVFHLYHFLIESKSDIEAYFLYDGTHAFYFVLLFSLGNLFIRFEKWRT